MSSDQPNPVPVTQADVHAAGAGISEAEMQAQLDKPAPASGFEQFMRQAGADLTNIKAVLGLGETLVSEAAPLASVFVPAAGPVLDRLPALESAVNTIVGALQMAFADHPTLPNMLPAPVAQAGTGS